MHNPVPVDLHLLLLFFIVLQYLVNWFLAILIGSNSGSKTLCPSTPMLSGYLYTQIEYHYFSFHLWLFSCQAAEPCAACSDMRIVPVPAMRVC